MEIDIAHIVEAVIAVAGLVVAALTYLGKKNEAKKVQAVVDGVEKASKGMTSEDARALKRKIQAVATTLGVQEALHRFVKAREKDNKE